MSWTTTDAGQVSSVAGQSSLADFLRIGPARRAVSGDASRLPRTPHRHADGDERRSEAARRGDGATLEKQARRISVVPVPPLEQPPWVIERHAKQVEPRRAKA